MANQARAKGTIALGTAVLSTIILFVDPLGISASIRDIFSPAAAKSTDPNVVAKALSFEHGIPHWALLEMLLALIYWLVIFGVLYGTFMFISSIIAYGVASGGTRD